MSTIAPDTDLPLDYKKKTIKTFHQKKERGESIAMLTGYDYPTALALDRSGIDAILVGDSLGMVVLGYENTVPVTMEEMLHHCRAVARGARSALLIGICPSCLTRFRWRWQLVMPDDSSRREVCMRSSWKADENDWIPSVP